MTELKSQIMDAVKQAMRDRNQNLLTTLRLITAAIKQIEVDERIDVDDARILLILDKMCKQRKDSISQFVAANRQELADKEQVELEIIYKFMPTQLTPSEITTLIKEAVSATGAAQVSDMGKVMGILKPKMQGRADMAQVSKMIKEQLST